MKTRLLKKVRKRYSIERIDFVNDRYIIDNPHSTITFHAQHNEFPIYQLIDNIGNGNYISIHYDYVYEYLLECIRSNYIHINQNKIIIRKTKIWWNK